VSKGTDIPDNALFQPNAGTAGVIKIGVVSVQPMGSNLNIATVSFPSATEPAVLTLTSVQLIDSQLHPL